MNLTVDLRALPIRVRFVLAVAVPAVALMLAVGYEARPGPRSRMMPERRSSGLKRYAMLAAKGARADHRSR